MTSSCGPARARRGSLLAETAISAVMLMIAMTIAARVVGWIALERRAEDRRQVATLEGANLMERLSARPFDGLSAESVKDVALSSRAVGALPGAELSIEVRPEDAGGVSAKRIALRLRWRNRAGDWDAPVRLTSWVHRRKEGS